MKAIWKFIIHGPAREIEMPVGAKILCVHAQNENPCIWAEVDIAATKERRTFHGIPTGEEFPDGGTYIGTVLLHGGALVFHIYEAPKGGA